MESVRFLGPDTDAFVDSVVRHAGEFTEKTGIRADLRIIPSDEYFSNRIHGYLDGEDRADVYMSGPVLLWEHIGAGYAEPLDAFLARADPGFDLDDVFQSLIASNRWTGKFGDPLGHGALWEIPVNCESYNLAYLPAALETHGCEVPRTWTEYFRTAELLQEKSGGEIRGFAQRGVQVWHTMYTGYATQFWSHGAIDFDANGRCAIASPEGIAATGDFIRTLRSSGPPDWPNQRWYELAMDFAAGRYGLIVDSDHYVAFFEDTGKSAIHGRTGYALPPVSPGGARVSNLWTWSLVMNARSGNKDNAWRFMEWAAGKPFLLRSAFEGNMNPTRKSVWSTSRFHEAASRWDGYYEVALRLLERDARVLVTPRFDYLRVADRWVRALRSAYVGDEDVAGALGAAAADIDAMTAGAG